MTLEAVTLTAGLYGGLVHGDDASGLVDVSFPNILGCTGFVESWREVTTVTLRGPIDSFDSPIVVQVQL